MGRETEKWSHTYALHVMIKSICITNWYENSFCWERWKREDDAFRALLPVSGGAEHARHRV